jgi:hypothetical protein
MNELNDKIGTCILKTNGYQYYLEVIEGLNALVSVRKGDRTFGYETWIIRRYSPTHKIKPNGLRFPSNEDFGHYGWYYPNKESALKKLEEIRQ